MIRWTAFGWRSGVGHMLRRDNPPALPWNSATVSHIPGSGRRRCWNLEHKQNAGRTHGSFFTLDFRCMDLMCLHLLPLCNSPIPSLIQVPSVHDSILTWLHVLPTSLSTTPPPLSLTWLQLLIVPIESVTTYYSPAPPTPSFSSASLPPNLVPPDLETKNCSCCFTAKIDTKCWSAGWQYHWKKRKGDVSSGGPSSVTQLLHHFVPISGSTWHLSASIQPHSYC